LVPIDPETLPRLDAVAAVADVRARDLDEEPQSQKVAIVVSDAERAFLIHFVPDDANVYAGKDIGVFTDQEAMVAAIRAIVEPHWTRAATFAQRQAEIRGMRPPEATRVVEPSEWDAALRAAAAHARRDARVALGEPLHDVSEAERVLAALPEGVPVRLLVNVDGPKAAEAARALVRPGVEVRHAAPRLALRKVLLDDREAFFSVGASGVVVHTNAAPALASLGESFARGWETAMPLDARVRELEVFPELRPGELGLGSLFDLLDDAVVVARRDGRIVLWSPSATRLFGVPPADALRRSLDKIVEPAHAEGLRRALARAATERVLVESACARPDGAPLQVEWALTPLAGRADLVIALGRDVTRRETARQAELRAHMEIVHVYERMTDAFLALDKGWRIVYRNPAVRRFQRTKTDAEIDGQVLWDAFPELRGTRYEAEYRRAMREMVPVHFTERYEPLGKTFEVNAYPSEDGLTVYFRDVTARADVPVQDKDEAPRARKRA
ncbi:MAG TPA: PAS domain-containing protein, partial [Candidatus Thermoplasmatota archaeon]|nr:PAS domain-containing protein [Candidatus Thermoplasmatota archaeon]